MQKRNGAGVLEPEKFITVTVVNVGDTPTTLTHLLLYHYSSRLRVVFRRPSTRLIVDPMAKPLPQLVPVGETWTAAMPQTEDIEKLLIRGLLYCGVRDEFSGKNTFSRIISKL